MDGACWYAGRAYFRLLVREMRTPKQPHRFSGPRRKGSFGFPWRRVRATVAHPKDFTSNIPRAMLQHSTMVARALTLGHRLARTPHSSPCNPSSAVLLDRISGYNYLVDTDCFKPPDIIFEGDSASSNLALTLVHYLVENHGWVDIPLPTPPGGWT